MQALSIPHRRVFLLLLAVGLAGAGRLQAYPEYQVFISKNSGRAVNCAMCHTHADGPEGTAPGQMGRLTPAEMVQLGRARAAFEPGAKVNNPILNAFGNHLVTALGKKKILELRAAPAQLAAVLPVASDLDADGIADAREYLDGTLPINPHDGRPWLLLKHNVQRYLSQILLTLAATVAGLYGLRHLLYGVAVATETEGPED